MSPVPPERPTEERLEDDGPSAETAAPSSQARLGRYAIYICPECGAQQPSGGRYSLDNEAHFHGQARCPNDGKIWAMKAIEAIALQDVLDVLRGCQGDDTWRHWAADFLEREYAEARPSHAENSAHRPGRSP